MKKTTVTILVPVYNAERYIGECAASLFEQTYKDIEFVFCDDCATDRSMAVLQETIERYPQRKEAVRTLRNAENKGSGYTRARLTGEVRTETFSFADADDVLPPHAIAALVECMERNDGADIADGAFADIANGQQSAPTLPFRGTNETFIRRLLCREKEPKRVWGRLYRTAVLAKLPNMFFEGIDYAEDYCASVRLATLTRRAWTDEVTYLYRTDNQSSYTKNVSRKSVISYIKASREVLRFFRQRGHLPFPLEVAVLNVFRECRRNSVALAEADSLLNYAPEHFRAGVLYTLLRSQSPIVYAIGDRLYRLFRLMASR